MMSAELLNHAHGELSLYIFLHQTTISLEMYSVWRG